MLPYLEAGAIYNACNFSVAPEWAENYGYMANSTATSAKVAEFGCPSDPNANQQTNNSNDGRYATVGSNNSYMGSQGTTTVGYPEATPNIRNAQQSTGIFAYQKCYNMASVTDGTSNTVAFAEMIADDMNTNFEMIPGKGTGGTNNLKGVYYYDVNAAGVTVVMADVAICNATYQREGGGREGGGYRWSTGAMGYTMFNTVIPPNGGGIAKWGACRNNCCPQTRHADYVNASSYHPGGVNVALTDGSVRFIKNSIAMSVWWAIGTRGNGEVVSSDSY